MRDTINIVYAPGTGGSHVANLISLNSKYSLNIDVSVYDDTLTENVHQESNCNRTNENVQINLFHIGGVLHTCMRGKFYPTSKNILIEFPTADSGIAYQRLIHWATYYQNKRIYFEQGMIYSKYLLTKIINSQWIVIDPSNLFSSHIEEIIIQLNQELNLDIDIDQATMLHTKWLDKIKNYVTQKSV